MSTILVTGAAGFIGFHVSKALLDRGETVIGLDNLNDYYDVNLKYGRLARLEPYENFQFCKLDVSDRQGMEALFAQHQPDQVIHLAAQAGVRYSLKNPHAYVDSNVVGFLHILEGCRQWNIQYLVYASSSSVYGANRTVPFSVHDTVDHPLSIYAATKKTNELMAHTYSHLYGIPTTGLRFFTVYGPWGRPDMATFAFTKAILEGQVIDIYNYGKMKRDFTYIDDIVQGVLQVLYHTHDKNLAHIDNCPEPESNHSLYRIYNIGNNQPIELLEFVTALENCLGMKARKNLLPLQPGDLLETYADISDLARDVGFQPNTPIQVGLAHFVEWYRNYYRMSPRSQTNKTMSTKCR